MGKILDPMYSTIILFFALFMPICGYIAIAVSLHFCKTVPAVCNKLIERQFRLWFSVRLGIFLPAFYIMLFVLIAFMRKVSFPINKVLVRGLAMILVSVPGFYLGTTLASRMFGQKRF